MGGGVTEEGDGPLSILKLLELLRYLNLLCYFHFLYAYSIEKDGKRSNHLYSIQK
jgi:hypothetical protein